MNKLDSIFQIRSSVSHIQSKLMSSEAEKVTAVMKEYAELVDRFQHENREFMTPQQCNAAKDNLEYFTFLVELALAHYKQKVCEGEI